MRYQVIDRFTNEVISTHKNHPLAEKAANKLGGDCRYKIQEAHNASDKYETH
tara:strand:- start:1066 stop:1221 length:156 start_codon:yes stop_codon:yes gene_type:complete